MTLAPGRDRWVALAVALVPIAFFSPVWATGRLFLSDGQYAAFFAPLANWSDLWIGGWPAGADTAAYVWYPIRVIALGSGLGFAGFVVSAYVIAALGTYAYLRLVGLASLAAAFGAVSFALSGFLVAHLLHTSMIHATAWVPWVFAGLEGSVSRGRVRFAVVTAVAVAMACLAGHLQIAAYGLVFAAAYLAWRVVATWRVAGVRAAMLAAAGLVLGLVLAAPQLVMTHDYLDETRRALLGYEDFVAFSLPLRQIPTVLFPFLFGADTRALGTPYFGAENFAELCLYVPFLSLLLAVPGWRFGPRAIVGFWALLALVALPLALGGSLPPVSALVYRVPGFNLFRVPARHVMELALALSVLAACGADWVLRSASPAALRRFAVVVVVLALVVTALSIPAHQVAATAASAAQIVLPSWSRDPAVRLGLASVAAGLLALAALATRTRIGVVAFAVCALFGLGSYAWLGNWRLVPTGGAPQPTALESAVAARQREGGGRVLHAQGGWGWPFTAGRTRLFGMPSLDWYGPLAPVRALDLLQMSPNGFVKAQTFAAENRVLDVYGVRWVAITDAAWEGGPKKRAALVPPRWRLVGREQDTAVYENARALPLAWLVPAWREVAPDEARRLLQEGAVDPSTEALVAGFASGGVPGGPAGTVDARWSGEGRITATVDALAAGFLVVSVNGVDGWRATVDGVPQPLFDADYALVGFPVPAGRHEVVLAFRVPPWQWAAPFGAALLGVVALATLRRRD